jgi:hypothetical protein
MSSDTYHAVNEYHVTDYQCGARAGDHVRLRHDIVVREHDGTPTGEVHPAGEIWTVLSGSAEPPVEVWLKQPDGKRHTWSDDDDFWNWFERVIDHAA